MTTSATVPNTGSQSSANPLKGLLAYGQSPWMDYIRRDLLTGGGLQKYIENDGLRGMTSNPTIFEKAINGSTLYSDVLNSPEAKSLNAKQLFEKLAEELVRFYMGAKFTNEERHVRRLAKVKALEDKMCQS